MRAVRQKHRQQRQTGKRKGDNQREKGARIPRATLAMRLMKLWLRFRFVLCRTWRRPHFLEVQKKIVYMMW